MSHFSDKYHRPYLMGVSIIIVFLYHLGAFTQQFDEVNIKIINYLFGRGDFGIDVFFFLSAYGLTYSINKNLICTFYLNRIKRIMPIYVLFLIGCVLFFITTDFSQILKYILASITGVAALKECHFQVEWYTPSLLFVYWFFPLINFVSKKIAKLNVCVIAVSIILLHFFCYHIDIGLCRLLAYRIPIIILGCVCYYLDKDDSINIYSVLSILAILGLFLFPGKVKLAIPAIVYLIGKSDKLPFHSCISVCGKYSFEIYLAQVVTTKYFILYYTGDVMFQTILVIIITVLLSTLFSLISKYTLSLFAK